MEQILVPLWYRLPHRILVSSVVEGGEMKHGLERMDDNGPVPGSNQRAQFQKNVLPAYLRFKRRHPGHEIYQQPVTAERKHTDWLHHGAVGVFVDDCLQFVFYPLKPPVRHCTIAPV